MDCLPKYGCCGEVAIIESETIISSNQGKKFNLKSDSRLLCLDHMLVLLNKAYYVV